MPLTAEQQKIRDEVERDHLLKANENIRNQLAVGVSVDDIAKQFGAFEGLDPKEILASMSIAETHRMKVGEAYSMLPAVLKEVLAQKKGSIDDVIKDFYSKSKDFKLPFEVFDSEEAREQIKLEEESAPEYKKQIGKFPKKAVVPSMGAFNQAYMIGQGLQRNVIRQKWFSGDPAKEQFLEEILAAETEEEKEAARKRRYASLVKEEQDRVQRLRDWEKRMEKLKLDPPGVWLSKLNAWRTGSGRLAQAGLDLSGELTDIIGHAFDSSSMKNAADDLFFWSRAYHKATQSPDLMYIGVNQFDEMTNAFLSNGPYVGGAILAATFSPEKLAPFTVFVLGAAMEGSEIKQTALDNGFPEDSARVRGWIGGTINGLIEASGGGAAKYNPKKLLSRIAKFPGKLTRNALREIFVEELPQEAVGMLCAGDVPYNRDGSINWDDVTDRFLIIARDTAFTSAVLTSSTSVVGETVAWDRKRYLNKQTNQAVVDAVDFIIAEQTEKDAKVQELAKELEESLKLSPERALIVARKKLVYDEQKAKEAAIEAEKAPSVAQEPPKPEISPEQQQKEIEAIPEPDDIKVETPPEAEDIDELIEETKPYGLLEQPDGKFAVIDWDTQHEIYTDLDRERAEREATALNAEAAELPKLKKQRIKLPTSQDIETLSHTALLRNLFKSISQHSRKIVSNTMKAIVGVHKNLSIYASMALKGLPITEGQRTALMKKVASARNEASYKQVVMAIEAIREIALQKQAIDVYNKLRRFINKAAKRRVGHGGIHYSVYETLRDLLNNYTSLSPKILNSLKRTQTYLDNLRDNISGDFDAVYAEALMPKRVTSKLGEIMRTPINDLSSDEITELNNTIKHYLKLNQLYNAITHNRKVREMRDFLGGAVANVKMPEKKKRGVKFAPQRGVWKTIWDAFLGIKNDDIYTIATRIWGKFDPISRMVRNGRRNYLKLVLKYTDMLRDVVNRYNITVDQLKRWSPLMHSIQGGQRIKTKIGRGVDIHKIMVGGVERSFTMAELMSVVLHSRNLYNMHQMVKNGISLAYERIGKVTRDEFNEMLQIVYNDTGARSFVDFLEQYYIEQAKDINKTSRNLDGRDIANIDNYFHIQYEYEGGVMGTEYVRDSLIDEEGRLKERTSSNRPVMIADIFEVLNEDIRVISQFVGLTEAIRKLRSLANYKPFRQRLEDSNAKHILSRMDEEIRSMQLSRQPPSGPVEKAVRRIETGVAQSILTDPQIWLLQPFSAVLYATEASYKYMKAIRPSLGVELEQELLKNWPLYRARKEGIGASKSIANPSTIRRIFTGEGNLRDKALGGLHKADQYGVTRAAQVVLAEMSDPQLSGRSLEWWQEYGVNPYTLEYGSEEFWDAFNDRADYLVTLTQPMFFAENRSTYTNSDNPLVRTFARFRSFIDQIGRIIRRQYHMAKYGQISKAEAVKNTAIALSVVSLIGVMIKHLFALAMGKKKEEGDFTRELLTSPLAVIPFAGYPAKQIAKALMGGKNAAPEISVMPIMLIENILKHSWEIAKGLNYAMDDEYIQTGPRRGMKKSEAFMKSGFKGVTEDYLTMYGVPMRAINRIDWWNED